MSKTCAVKYCGGCNPTYQRTEFLEHVKKQVGDQVKFQKADENIETDLLLVLMGCSKACAQFKQYKSKSEPILAWSNDHADEIIKKIKKEVDSN